MSLPLYAALTLGAVWIGAIAIMGTWTHHLISRSRRSAPHGTNQDTRD
mgnify:CR=1 FL=1